jgi:hypothetical protein
VTELGDQLAAVLAERGPLPAGTLAREVSRRNADVFAALRADGRFHHVGKRRGSRWSVEPLARTFDVNEAAERWRCSRETAGEIIFGLEGLLERGLVERVNGNDTVAATAAGVALSRLVALGVAP